jgi:polyisoprenoid-binding protein YceI
MKKYLLASAVTISLMSPLTHANDYIIDHKGAHASVNFKIKHLGYSWLTGRFDKFKGTFSYDADNLAEAKIAITIDTASVNSNHAERDKHLRNEDFLEVNKFTAATFVSSKISKNADDTLLVKGLFTLHGVSKEIIINAEKIGEGKDPWGGYRAGFSGTSRIALKDFGIKTDLGPASSHVELSFHIEGKKI